MSVEFRISVLIAVLFTGQSTICDAAAGDWIRPALSNGERSGTLASKVPEYQRIGQTNAHVQVEGATSYRILSQTVDGLFTLQKNGSLNITSRLDYENATSYALVVAATDGKGMANTATVIVRIEDKNDNAPVFPGAPYLVVLPDNSTEDRWLPELCTCSIPALHNAQMSMFCNASTLESPARRNGGDLVIVANSSGVLLLTAYFCILLLI